MNITVATRPVRPADAPLFCRFWDRLSPDTIYRRFHAPLPRPPLGAQRLVEVDHDRREAIAAVVGSDIIGVARYDRSPGDPSTAEIAVVVEDAWQGMGVGRQLVQELTAVAGGRGIQSFTAIVQPDNDRIVGLIRRLLPGSRFTREDDVLAVESPVPAALLPIPA